MIDDLPLGRPPTHILHVSQPVDGGTAVVVEQLAAADLDHGRTVTIASPPGRLGEWASGRGVHWVELPLTRQPGLADLSAIAALRRLLPAAHVAYLHSSKAGAVGRMALAATPRDRRPKCVFIPHAWSWYVGGRAAPVYRQFERLASHWADAIVVLSTTEATDGRTVLPPTATHRVVQIHNGVDTAAYSTAGPVSDRAPGPLVVCVGRLSEQKGQDALIGALGLLADPDVMLRLIGDGPDASRLPRPEPGARPGRPGRVCRKHRSPTPLPGSRCRRTPQPLGGSVTRPARGHGLRVGRARHSGGGIGLRHQRGRPGDRGSRPRAAGRAVGAPPR